MRYKSITVTARGGLDAVRIIERDLRAPAPGEARIRVLASAVCQDDVAIRVGNRPFLRKPPYVPGYSFVGVVDAVGDGVTEVAVGDRVTALTSFDSHAEVIYRRAGDLAPVPEDIDPVAASTLILNYLVAQQILHRVAHVRPGDTALIIGASGGVGTARCSWVRWRVCGCTARRHRPSTRSWSRTGPCRSTTASRTWRR